MKRTVVMVGLGLCVCAAEDAVDPGDKTPAPKPPTPTVVAPKPVVVQPPVVAPKPVVVAPPVAAPTPKPVATAPKSPPPGAAASKVGGGLAMSGGTIGPPLRFEDESSVTKAIIDPDLVPDPPRSLTLFGDGFYEAGEITGGRFSPTMVIFGDLRSAYAYIQNANNNNEVETVRTVLTTEVDLRLTHSERIHARFEPLSEENVDTRYDIEPVRDFEFESDFQPVTLFFEGELGSIIDQFSDWNMDGHADLNYHIAAGLFPLELHNGYLFNDVVGGVAVTKNNLLTRVTSPLNNAGLGLIYAWYEINANTGNGGAAAFSDDAFWLAGAHGFFDVWGWHAEASVFYLGVRDPEQVVGGYDRAQTFEGLSLAHWSGRTGIGMHFFAKQGDEEFTGNGYLGIFESNIRLTPIQISPEVYGLFTAFWGTEDWSTLSGNLNQIGALFQTDALTGFPNIAADATDLAGVDLAVQYKTLHRRLHFIPEVAYVDDRSDADNNQFVAGIRINYGFGRRHVLRFEGRRFEPDVGDGFFAARLEYQVKY